ncbi:unnamed protein product [Penicillium discolor]
MTGTRTDCNRDICIPLYYWDEAMLAGPGLIKASSDADTLQPGLCLLFDLMVNHFRRSIASFMHSLNHLLTNVYGKAGTEKKTHSILPLSVIMVAIVNTAWESKDHSKDHLNEDETPINEQEKLFEKATFDQWD